MSATTSSVAQQSISMRPKTVDFDIVGCYHRILNENADLTPPVAAIETLIAMLNATSTSTVYETLEMTKKYAAVLKTSVRNPLPLTAGMDIFQHFVISWLKQDALRGGPALPFDAVRDLLVQNSYQFAARAREARTRIANAGWRFVRDEQCVMTHGASRTVTMLLLKAAQESKKRNDGTVRFKVIYVRDAWREGESNRIVNTLRSEGIPVAEIPNAAVAHVLAMQRQVNAVFVGAEVVTQDGGAISRLGTLQLAKLAQTSQPPVPFYVATEEYKFLRHMPRYQRDVDVGCPQSLLDFTVDKDSHQPPDPVDWTEHTLITNFITDSGVKPPSYVGEQLLATYGNLTPAHILERIQQRYAEGRI